MGGLFHRSASDPSQLTRWTHFCLRCMASSLLRTSARAVLEDGATGPGDRGEDRGRRSEVLRHPGQGRATSRHATTKRPSPRKVLPTARRLEVMFYFQDRMHGHCEAPRINAFWLFCFLEEVGHSWSGHMMAHVGEGVRGTKISRVSERSFVDWSNPYSTRVLPKLMSIDATHLLSWIKALVLSRFCLWVLAFRTWIHVWHPFRKTNRLGNGTSTSNHT